MNTMGYKHTCDPFHFMEKWYIQWLQFDQSQYWHANTDLYGYSFLQPYETWPVEYVIFIFWYFIDIVYMYYLLTYSPRCI